MKLLTLILVAAVVATVLSRPSRRGPHHTSHHGVSRSHHEKELPQERHSPQRSHGRRQVQTPGKCAQRCTGVKSKFHYKVGQSYTYSFESTSKVQFIGSRKPESALRQTANVVISAIEPCEFSLKLSNVGIEGHNDGSWKEELERRPLRFSFDDGIIGEICPDSADPAWALNIKRAILSTFQNGLEGSSPTSEVYESDVSGNCPTKYELKSESGGQKMILKTKDLVACENHHGNYSALRGVQYKIKSELQNAPLLDSNQECRHTISRNILREATCTEKHNFRPFRKEKGSGILSTVQQKLEFQSEGTSQVQAPVGTRKSLNFDHSEFEFEASAEGASLARANLRELCQISSSDVRPETPGLFTELVYNLRKLQFTELKQLSTEVASNGICPQDKKFFYDAVPVCGTEACVKLTVDILKSRSLSERETISWVTALSLVPKPTLEMVRSVSEISDRMEPNALLGISSLIYGYCRENPGCDSVSEVSEFTAKLIRKLGDKCTSVRDHTSKAVFLLKAIGNVGNSYSAVPVLLSCVNENRNPEEIRLAAIQALRRMPCGQQKDSLLGRFRDTAEDIEVRITSFLTLMKCPSAELITDIKGILEQESVTQVGSFVYSYLKAKSSTSDPFHQELYNLLRSLRLDSKFNRDPRKFSRFYEFGRFMESSNMGGHAEAGLIMEPEGYLPRQGFLNLTLHLFGTSVNLFEIGARTQGVERLADKLFGPDGYFSNPSGYYLRQDKAPAHSNARVKTIHDLFSQKKSFSEHLAMSMYLKIFGDDLAYYNFKNENMVDEIRNMLDTEKLMAKLAKHQTLQVSRNILFLDSTLTVPTISGIPLRLAVNGTASLHVEYGGKLDFSQLLRPPHTLDIQGEIKPSAAIELSSTLAMHVRNMKTGVKMVGRMHTSTAAKGLLQFRNGEFKTTFELPDDQMEVIDIQTQLYHIVKNTESEEPGVVTEKMETESCSCDTFNRVTGVKICSSMTMPKRAMRPRVPYFPLTGPMRARIIVEKADPTLSSYEMTMKYVNKPGDYEFQFGVNTPGSTVDRNVNAKVQYKPGQSIVAELRTPVKELKLDGTMTKDRDIQQGRLGLLVDNTERYSVAAKLQKTVQRGGNMHTFEAEVDMPDREDVKFTGNIKTQSKRYELNFNMDGLYPEPVEGKLLWEQPETGYNKFNSELMFKCPAIHLDVKANGKADPTGNMDYKYTVEYKRPQVDATPHKIVASQVQTVKKEADLLKVQSVSTFSSSWYPDGNSQSTFMMTKGDNIFEMTLNTKYGADKKTMDFAYATRITEGDKYTSDISFLMPQFRLNENAKMIYQNRYPSMFLGKISWPTFKNFEGELSLRNSNDNLWRMEAEAKAKYTGRELRLFNKIDETTPQNYKSEVVFQWQTGKQIEVDSDIILKSQRGVYEYEVNAVAKMSGQPDTITFRKTFKMGRRETKYIALARKGTESLYDFKLDMIKESETKTNFQTQLKSDWMNNMDYDVAGSIEKQQRTTKVEASIKKDRKDWMKGEVILPTQVARSPEVRVKGQLFWDLDTPQTKEVMGDYKLIKSGSSRTHEWQMKIKANQADYSWNAKVVKAEYYIMNSTLSKNNQPLIESHWGGKIQGNYLMDPRDLAIDFKLRTYAPMTPQHLTGLLTHTHGPREFKTTGYIQCHQHNKRAGFDVEGKEETVGRQGKKYIGKMLFKVNNKQFEANEEWVVPKMSEWWAFSGKSTYKLGWEAGKEVILTEEIQTGPVSFLKGDLKTPFAKLSEMKAEIRLENLRTTPKLSSEFTWNRNKRIYGEITGDVAQPKSLDLTLLLETSFEALKKMESKLKYNFNNQWDVETWIKWNDEGTVKFLHKRITQGHKYTADIDVECVIPGKTNWIGSAKVEHDGAQHKYTADCRLTLGDSEYKLEADVNTNRKTGELKLQTPYETLNSARITVSKLGNNEYKIETEKNGESSGSITAMIKPNEMKFEVDSVRYPFNVIYEGQYDNNKWHIKAELNVDPNKASKKSYGLQLTDEKKSQGLAESQLVLKHPRRQMHIKIHRDSTQPEVYKFTAEIQPNMASSRAPTKFMYLCRTQDPTHFQELKITDPSIPKGIKMTYKMDKEGRCTSSSERCRHAIEIKLDYSGETAKTLVMKSNFLYEPARSAGEYKVTAEGEITHPATDLYAKLYFRTPRDRTWETGMEFKNAQRVIKAYSTSLEYARDMSSITLNFITPEDQWATRYSKLNENSCQFMLLRNGQPSYETIVTYNRNQRLVRMEIKKSRSSEVLFHVSARLTNGDIARIMIWHTEQGRRIDDAEFTLKLDKADLLRTKVFVRPGFSRELQHVTQQKVDQWKADQQKTNKLQEVSQGYYRSISSTGSSLRSDMRTHMEPFTTYLSQEKDRLVGEIGPAMGEVTEQIQVYLEMARELLFAFMDVVEMSMDQLMETVPSDNFKDYYYSVKQTVSAIPENLAKMAEPMTESYQKISELFSDISGKMSDAKNRISEKLNLQEAKRKIQQTWEDMQNSDLVKQVKSMYDSAVSSLTGLSPSEAYNRYYNKGSFANYVEQRYEQVSSSMSSMWEEWRDSFLEYQVGQYLSEWAQELGKKLRSTYTYVDAEDKIDNVITWLRELISSYNPTSEKGFNQYMPTVKVNDPESGRYEMEIPLPMKVRSLEHLASKVHPDSLMAMKSNIQRKWNSMVETQRAKENEITEPGYSVWDTVYHYKPASWKPVKWLPPYESTAFLIGGHHFVTFDGHVYDFAANCEYLMARDFHDKKFTITASFKRGNGHQSSVELDRLKIHTNGHHIEIPKSGSVKVDGRSTELPWQKLDDMDGKILAEVQNKNYATVLKTQDGLKIECTREFYMCSIALPGRYHGKSAGMLGSNDNEPRNDLMKPDKTRAANVDEFAASWHVGSGDCQSQRNTAPTARVQPNSVGHTACKRMFHNNNSPLRAGFSQVKPGPYMTMCTIDMEAYGQTAWCNISAAYIAAAKRVGISLELPNECSSCSAPGEPSITEGDSTTVESGEIPKTADVVFAVEERKCMEWSKNKLPEFGRLLQGELRKKQIRHVRFGVVGFGGEGVHSQPHFHTGSSHVAFDLNGLQLAAAQLSFEKITMAELVSVDPMKTMDFLTGNFPWRPATEKIVVLLTCTECGSKTVGYYDLQNKLLDAGIRFHMITDKEVELESDEEDEGDFIGLDASSLFDGRSSNSELRGDLVNPHDSCTILAQETNGTVFSSSGNKQTLVSRMSQEMGRKFVSSTCQECECQVEKLTPTTICYPCDIPRPVSLSGSDKFFNIPYLKLKKSYDNAKNAISRLVL